MRLLICGDRNWTNEFYIMLMLKVAKNDMDCDTVIEGEANGADKIAAKCAKYLGLKVLPFPANWNKYGKAAGYIRNKQMIDEGKPGLILAFHNNIDESRGTRNMLELAKANNIPAYLISKGSK